MEALANIEAFLRLSRVRAVAEEGGFLDIYRDVTNGLAARGNHVPDGRLAALLRQADVRTLYTADADFKRFGFLDVRNPFI